MNKRVFHTRGIFTDTEFDGNNIVNISTEKAKAYLHGVAISKFGYGSQIPEDENRNILLEEAEDGLVCILALGPTSVSFLDKDLEKIQIDCGDMVMFESNIKYSIDDYNLVKYFILKCEIKENLPGDGKIVYEVVSTIRDEYRIKVKANNPEEAIKVANTVPLNFWKHPDIEPHLRHRVVTRHARWGNLMATKIRELDE